MRPLPDFILLDMHLPLGDPYKICRMLQSDPMLAGIPVIALCDETNRYSPQIRHAGFAGSIAKPLPRRHFGDFLTRVLTGNSDWAAV
jgi:CheY-like chemotaxis protein